MDVFATTDRVDRSRGRPDEPRDETNLEFFLSLGVRLLRARRVRGHDDRCDVRDDV